MRLSLMLIHFLAILSIEIFSFNTIISSQAADQKGNGHSGPTISTDNIESTSGQGGAQHPSSTDDGDHGKELFSFISIYQPYVGNISFYKPMYFLVGTAPKNSKFQFSFKYRLFNRRKPLTSKHPWIEGIHFAYTQTSFWDLASDSQPFEDTSYKPEIFFLSRNIDTGLAALKGCFVQTGLQHESNGRALDQSRSTNFAYLEPSFIFMNARDMTGLKISPRCMLYIGNDDETNPDLPDYRGYFDLGLTFGKADALIVDTHLRWAREGGSLQADLTFPLHRLFRNNIDMYLQVEYVNALAEHLISYEERLEALRIGLAVIR